MSNQDRRPARHNFPSSPLQTHQCWIKYYFRCLNIQSQPNTVRCQPKVKTTGKVVSRHLICGILRVLGTLHTSQGLWLEGLSRVGGKGGRPCGCWGTRQSKALRTQLRAPWTVWGKGVTPLDAHVRTTPAVPDKQPGTAQPPGLKLHTLGVGAIPWKQTLPPGPSQTPERAWMSRGRTRSGVGSRRTTAESYRSQCLFPELQTSRRFYCQARARSPVGSHYAGAASPQPARAPTRPAPTPTPAASLQGSRFTVKSKNNLTIQP